MGKQYNVIKPVIKYFGGKSNMLTNLYSYFPSITQYSIFIDLFGGSGSVLLGKEPNGVEIYNDLEENVYSLHKVISSTELFPEFKNFCDKALYIEKTREEYREDLKTNLGIVERAFKFFYVNRTSQNGVGGFSTNSIIRRGMSKSTSDFLSCIDRLPEIHNRLSSVIILQKDALELINKYGQDDNVFIYADPPYHHSTRTSTRYKVDFSNEQHKNFIDVVMNTKCKILISGYDCNEYTRLEESGKWSKYSFEVKTIDGNSKPKTKIEYVWRNYIIAEERSLFS